MFQELSRSQIESVLQHRIFGHIGCHTNGLTYVVPICYAYDQGYIFGRTAEGLKLEMMRENPEVCFQVEHVETMVKWESVVCWGVFKELSNTEDRLEAIRVLQGRVAAKIENDDLLQSSYWPFAVSDSDKEGILFCIELKQLTGRCSVCKSEMSPLRGRFPDIRENYVEFL
ncbi:pyridoxamine 5'-phosphate oxidase family protein [Niabella drilacis]|uniref:Pyridoxamine 5'-phosphate oxidase n=1 Tax=Niabella drilacis (strain DSM 25811 / CCM 8410 / CCUG 62505 / LMG 26954 / E90) TaxID=1285928 RepID=A0A1G6RDG1_NIADE|nr:pyridoxamine 5'-phosphate oxidase family protein [Niabella drilacis]SDD02344.1 Pyridoxamine 5'-phosphate oxidase [Niabella drilacis]